MCQDKNFINILFGNQWSIKKIKSMGLSKRIDDKHPFFRDLSKLYLDHFESKGALLNKKLDFYDSITYTVLKNEQESIRLKLHVSDIVELSEESEGIAYAKISLIFRHQANNNHYYAFFLFDWFQATDIIDPILECPLYNIQKPKELRWIRIFPINVIDHIPHVHFIHKCENTCNINHDETNRCYIFNRFYYNAI